MKFQALEVLAAFASLALIYFGILWAMKKSRINWAENQRLITALKAAAAIALSVGGYAVYTSESLNSSSTQKSSP